MVVEYRASDKVNASLVGGVVKQLRKGKAVVFIGIAAMCSFSAVWTGASARADEGTVTASSSKTDLDTQLARSSTSSSATIEELREEIQAEHRRTLQLEQRLDALQQNQESTVQKQTSLEHVMTNLQVGRGNETTPNGASQADVYDRGFFLRSKNGKFSLSINGLMQIRYSLFKPNSIGRYGMNNNTQSDFEVYLGRLAFSGNVFDPSLKYFMQIQGFTTGNSNNMTLLDWFGSKTFNKYLTLQAGRSWTAYTWEFYANPAWLTFPDLSTAEYAFVLPRATGLAAYGQAGKLSYEAELTNGVPALDSGGNENFGSNMAYIGHLQYDILAPAFFGYSETHPESSYADKPGLSIWGSGMYNPVNSVSTFENELPGDTTYGANSSLGFRLGYYTAQATGYYRHTIPGTMAKSLGTTTNYDSWGYAEQMGYYLIPGQWEIAQRISGVSWGSPEIRTAAPGSQETYWFSGPDLFSYNKITEFSGGINYYYFGQNAKIQLEYSYLAGSDFHNNGFGANRLWLQSQIQF
jgi:hypothetical protein